MCVHIYYAYSILSNIQEKLETLVKIMLGYSFSSSYNCFGLQAHKEKYLYSYIRTHQLAYIHAYIKDVFLHLLTNTNILRKILSLRFTYKYNQMQSNLHTQLDFTMQMSQAEICKEMPPFSQVIYKI